jgi:hypothetical protein
LFDLCRYRELKSVDNVVQKGLLVTVAHHGWKEKEKEEGGWRGSMKREDGNESIAERLQSVVVVVTEEV